MIFLIDLGCWAEHSCDMVGNSLCILGGLNGKKALNDFYFLDLDKLIFSTFDNSSSVPQAFQKVIVISENYQPNKIQIKEEQKLVIDA